MGLGGWFGFQFEIAGDSLPVSLQHNTSLRTELRFRRPLVFGRREPWLAGMDLVQEFDNFRRKARTAITYCFKMGQYCLPLQFSHKGRNDVHQRRKDEGAGLQPVPVGDAKTTVVGLKFAGPPRTTHWYSVYPGQEQSYDHRFLADYNDPNNNHFKGQLDDIMIFHKASSH